MVRVVQSLWCVCCDDYGTCAGMIVVRVVQSLWCVCWDHHDQHAGITFAHMLSAHAQFTMLSWQVANLRARLVAAEQQREEAGLREGLGLAARQRHEEADLRERLAAEVQVLASSQIITVIAMFSLSVLCDVLIVSVMAAGS